MTSKPANKPIIAVDIDDVISDQNGSMRLFANRRFGHNHTADDYKKTGSYWGYWGEVWEVPEEEERARVEEYNSSGELLKQKLIPGAIEAIGLLEKNYSLEIVTSRKDKHFEDTHKWLDKHFRGVFKGVHFAKVWDDGRREDKAVICKRIGADYLIDDNAEHCNIAAEGGVKSLLFGDYGWSRGAEVHPEVVRVGDWQEVLEYFDDK